VTTIYKVRSKKDLPPSHPYHVGRFYSFERLHRRKQKDRQDLILYLASLHANTIAQCIACNQPRGFCEVPLRLTTLRDWVYDYHAALDYFFTVKQIGYNFGDGDHVVSTLIPNDLGFETIAESTKQGIEYLPPDRPDDGVVSKVYIQQQNAAAIRLRLAEENRADLRAACEWILGQTEINFIFQPAGKLKQRDTSVWPVAAVETWPSWLREALFGQGIDIESAYTQYLLDRLEERCSPSMLKTLYPDIIRSVHDKAEWRRELCVDVLGLAHNDENIAIVKKICMSLANGSRISPGILTAGAFSVTADVIIQSTTDVSVENLDRIGSRLQRISQQYSTAKKIICAGSLRLNPTRNNQKLVFSSYFEWERTARYLIWEAVGRHGIMVHDGIDGIPAEYLTDLPALMDKIKLKVTS
jgi:hypothetical protein